MACIMDNTELEGMACLENDCCHYDRELRTCMYKDNKGSIRDKRIQRNVR